MSAATDQAEDLLKLAGGPSLIAVSAALGYAKAVLGDKKRKPRKGWAALGAGALGVAWLVVFIVLAAPTIWHSLTAEGPVEPLLVLLALTWACAVGLCLFALAHVRKLVRYLAQAYPPTSEPSVVRGARWVLCLERE